MSYEVEICCASALTVASLLLALVYRYVTNIYKYFEAQGVQGPKPKFLVGTWSELSKKFLGDEDVANSKRYGKIYGTFDGLTPNLIVTDCDVIRQIIATSADNFQDRRVATARNLILKRSLLSLCGEEDKQVHDLINSSFADDKIEKLLPRLETPANSLVRNIAKSSKDDGRVELNPLLTYFIHDVIALAVFGADLNADNDFRHDFLRFASQIFTVKNNNSCLAILPHLFDSLPGDSWVLPERATKYFANLISDAIKANSRNAASSEPSLVDLFVEAAEEEKKLTKKEKENENENANLILTDEVIVSKCISSLLALANSTKATVLLSLHALAQNQEVQEKLSNEIQKNKFENISYAEIQNSPYLDMVLAEVLRLYPTEFRLEKICTNPVTLGNVKLDKGVRVSVPLFALHLTEENFAAPDKFEPERFSPETSEKRNPYCYLPFGQAGLNGSNTSLQIALLTAKLTIYKLVEKFRFGRTSEEAQALFKAGITGVPQAEAIQLVVEPRKAF